MKFKYCLKIGLLGNVKLMPAQGRALYRSLLLLAAAPLEQRTITNLITQVQGATVRDELSPCR
jgi:hypothetical protein